MAYVRKQIRGKRTYYYLVESERQGSRVKQRVLQYLGTARPTDKEVERVIKHVRVHKRRITNK